MSEQNSPNAQPASAPTRTTHGRRRSLYRTVLSLAVAALAAAWLPFSVFYITALNKPAGTVTAVSAPHSAGGTVRVVTTASGATRLVGAGGAASAAGGAPSAAGTMTPVTTHAS